MAYSLTLWIDCNVSGEYIYRWTSDWTQASTSRAPTGGELLLPEVLVNSIPTPPTQPAVLLHTPGYTQHLCSGITQAWISKHNMYEIISDNRPSFCFCLYVAFLCIAARNSGETAAGVWQIHLWGSRFLGDCRFWKYFGKIMLQIRFLNHTQGTHVTCYGYGYKPYSSVQYALSAQAHSCQQS